jgi:hypothetical protein
LWQTVVPFIFKVRLDPDDEGSVLLCNVRHCLPSNVVSHPAILNLLPQHYTEVVELYYCLSRCWLLMEDC